MSLNIEVHLENCGPFKTSCSLLLEQNDCKIINYCLIQIANDETIDLENPRLFNISLMDDYDLENWLDIFKKASTSNECFGTESQDHVEFILYAVEEYSIKQKKDFEYFHSAYEILANMKTQVDLLESCIFPGQE